MARRRRRRNPSAIGTFMHEHPFLFAFFVLPTAMTVVLVPVAIVQALASKSTTRRPVEEEPVLFT